MLSEVTRPAECFEVRRVEGSATLVEGDAMVNLELATGAASPAAPAGRVKYLETDRLPPAPVELAMVSRHFDQEGFRKPLYFQGFAIGV